MALAGSVADTLNACTSCAAAGNGAAAARRDASRSALIESVTRGPRVAIVPPFCALPRLLLRLRYTYRRPHTGEMNERGFPPNRELIQSLGGSWLEPDDVAIAIRPRLERLGRGRRKSVQIGRAEDAYDRFFGQGRVIDHDLPPVVAIDLRDRRLQGFPVEGHQALAPGELPVCLGRGNGSDLGRLRQSDDDSFVRRHPLRLWMRSCGCGLVGGRCRRRLSHFDDTLGDRDVDLSRFEPHG